MYYNCTSTVEKGAVCLQNRDGRPIYIQIMDSLESQIQGGVLLPGDKLPSVRELAAELAINPNTIQRAYRELEQQGKIETIPGKGCFVCQNKADPHGLWEQFDAAARGLKALGITDADLITRLKGE